MAAEFANGVPVIQKSLKKTADDILYLHSKCDVKDESEAAELNDFFAKEVTTLMNLESEAHKLQEVVGAMMNQFKDTDEDISNRSNYDELFEKTAKKMKNLKGDEKYFKDITKSIRNEDKNDADEMEVMQVQHSRMDPISKKDIINPVINESCGHVYDRDSIHQFAGKKRSIKCAMQGCSETITISRLVDYPDYWKNIKQQQ